MTEVERVRAESLLSSSTFVPAVRVDDLVFVSGQVALTPDGEVVGKGDFEQQAEQVFKNLSDAAQAAGTSMENAVKITTFLVDPDHYSTFNEVRARYLSSNPTASSTVIVRALVRPELLVEVEAIFARTEK